MQTQQLDRRRIAPFTRFANGIAWRVATAVYARGGLSGIGATQ